METKMKALTTRQRRFVEAFDGNATQAAILAGYSEKTAYSQGQRMLKKVEIQTAIQARENKRMEATIANRQQRQEFWTSTMWDKEQSTRDRLKASELLGKSEGDFLERHDHTNSDGSMAKRPILSPRETMAALLKQIEEEDAGGDV